LVWALPVVVSIGFFLLFGLIDGSFVISTLQKVADGGWFTLSMATILAIVMFIWKWGTTLRVEYEIKNKVNLYSLFENPSEDQDEKPDNPTTNNNQVQMSSKSENSDSYPLRLLNGLPVARIPGVGLYYQDAGLGVPLSFSHYIHHFPAVPEVLVFISIRPVAVPQVSEDDRIIAEKVERYEGVYRVIVRYGYTDSIDQGRQFVQNLLKEIARIDPKSKVNSSENKVITHVVGRQTIHPCDGNWARKVLLAFYSFMFKNSTPTASNWKIPVEDIVDVGVIIPL